MTNQQPTFSAGGSSAPASNIGPYKWYSSGDINAFFGLMLDNMTQLVILGGILIGVFSMPADIVLTRMIPGTAFGVMIGDIIYTWLAIRLARRTGKNDVCAMPLGIDTVSLFGISFAVLGPVYLATQDAELTWQVGMAVTVIIGAVKLVTSFFGDFIRRTVPRAALLGSIAGIAAALISFFPTLKIMRDPVTGIIALGLILMTLIGRYRLPAGIPGVFAAVLLGSAAYYVMQFAGLALEPMRDYNASMQLALPWPGLGFIGGLSMAFTYLPLAVPLAIVNVLGGIDVTESASAAGDEYNTRSILLTEGAATLIAGLCGGVIQNTPYIGHPAYKSMGGRAGYTFATAIFVGLGGIIGYLPMMVDLLPEAALAPILMFIGLEIVSQSFRATPAKYFDAVAISFIPSIGYLVSVQLGGLIGAGGIDVASLPHETAMAVKTAMLLGNGFVVTALVWGSMTAALLDHRPASAARLALLAALLASVGAMHSPDPAAAMFMPWNAPDSVTYYFTAGYTAVSALFALVWYTTKNPGNDDPAT